MTRARACGPVVVALTVLVAGLPAMGTAAQPPVAPGRVLILHSFGLHFQPFANVATVLRTELAARSPRPVEFHDMPLEAARFGEGEVDQPLADYVHALNAHEPFDLIIAVGSPAFRFCLRRQASLFEGIPILGAGIDQRHLAGVDRNGNVTVVPVAIDVVGLLDDILRLRPQTAHVSVVLGTSPLEQYWREQTRKEWEPFGNRIAFTWLSDLTLPQIVEHAAALPPDAAIVFALMDVDAAGVPYERNSALDALHGAAGAPIFGFFTPDLGHGTVGGRLIDVQAVGVASAVAAVRILAGETPSAVTTPVVPATDPVYDWRELRRWGIAESLLPPGSEVRFRAPTLWTAYRTQIIVAGAVLLIQTLLIALYLANRIRLRSARAELADSGRSVQELRRELSHAGRVSLLGQFTASLAHELGQPLGAILRNAEAAELFLKSDSPDIEEIQAILADVRKDGRRAGDVIERLRTLLSRRSIDMQPLAWDEVVDEVLRITRADARARAIVLEVDTPPGLPTIRGDRIHVLQVLLNLVSNAMDAVDGNTPGAKRVAVSARSNGSGFVECAVSDSGAGVAADQIERLFEPFATTKEKGMGMGLPISRAIVEAHGGRLWAENNPDRGATFRFTIPVYDGKQRHG